MGGGTLKKKKDELEDTVKTNLNIGGRVAKLGKEIAGEVSEPLGKAGKSAFKLAGSFVRSQSILGGLETTGSGFSVADIAKLKLNTDVSKTVKRASDVKRPEVSTKTTYLGSPQFANITEEEVDTLFGNFLSRQAYLRREQQKSVLG